MTENEYLEKRREIDERHENDINALELFYCLSKTPYKIGDIVQDHIGAVRITDIRNGVWHSFYDRNSTNISLIFKGIDVKKADFTPKKKSEERDVYESNIEKILKKNNE